MATTSQWRGRNISFPVLALFGREGQGDGDELTEARRWDGLTAGWRL
jgi:hypothetical protein